MTPPGRVLPVLTWALALVVIAAACVSTRPVPTADPPPSDLATSSASVGGAGSTPSPSPSLGGSPDPSGSSTASASASTSPDPSANPTRRPFRSREPLPSLDPLPTLAPDAPRPDLSKQVVAYLPYWVTSGDWTPETDLYIQGGRLTDLVLFSVGVRRDGSLRLDEPGADMILGSTGEGIIREAHEHGIRVLVSFTSFGREHNAALFSDELALDRFVGFAAELVALRGLDGADLDVEQIDNEHFRLYARTAGRLADTLRARDPLAQVTVATNGNRSGARMAAMALRAGADRAFLMGYSYRGPTSNPVGSISPIERADADLDLRDSFELYLDRNVDLSRVLVGLPAYGMTWATVGPELHADRAPSRVSARGAIALFRNVALDPPAGATADVDVLETSARLTWFDRRRDSWFQTYYDTPETLRDKYLLAYTEGLAGVGMWTLGYDGGLPGYPQLVDEVFGGPVISSVEIPQFTTQLAIDVRVQTFDGPATTTGIRLSNDGLTWSDWFDLPARGALPWVLAEGGEGVRTVVVEARDGAGRISKPWSASLMYDPVRPTIAGLGLRPAPIAGSWLVTFAASDPGGLASVEIRDRGPIGTWGPWRTIRGLADGVIHAAPGERVWVELRVTDRAGNTSIRVASAL